MNKTVKASVFKATLLASLMSAALVAQAAGLGRLTVHSGIGQPLRAEIAISATPEEVGGGMSARLASHKEFSDAGIAFVPLLAGLRFSIDKKPDGTPVLHLATDVPVNEPFLHFLVELSWASGRVVREYTFLLDPPETLQPAKPAAAAAPAAPAERVEPSSTTVSSRPHSAPTASAAPRTGAPPAKPAAVVEIVVKPGDTLSKIAREHKVDTVSLDQMLVALFNRNRDAFDGGNMNRLRAGRILRVPEAAEAAAVDAQEARKLVVAQAADFDAYRRRLAGAVLSGPAQAGAPAREAAGKIVAEVETKAPAAPKQDKLEVSRTEPAKGPGQAGARSLEENLIARDKALREANERIAQLEKNIEHLKQLIEIRSKAGAELQQRAKEATPTPQSPATPQPTTATPQPPQVASAPAEPAVAAAPPAPAPERPVVAEAAKDAGTPPAAQPSAQEPAAGKPAEPAPAPAPAPAPTPAPVPAKPPEAKPPAAPPPAPGFIEENPAIVFGAGGIVALLLAYLGYSAWRRKKKEKASESQGAAESAGPQGAVAAAAPASALADRGAAEASLQGDFSEGGVLTAEESSDPVAEADVLMAYGRDSQAEEILREGLKSDPARTAIYLKLLELYANRKDADRFDEVARRLHELTHGQGDDWSKALALAKALGVASALFPAAATAAESLMEEAPSVQEERPAAPRPEAAAETVESADETVVLPASPLASPKKDALDDDGALDFDLDLGTSDASVAPTAEAAADKPVAEGETSLDFDFDLGIPEPAQGSAREEPVREEPVQEEPVRALAPEAPTTGLAAVDFDLDLGSGEPRSVTSGVEAEEPPIASPAAKRGLGGGIEVDFDLELDAPPTAPVAIEPTPAMADLSLDLGEPTQVAAEAPLDLDLSLDVDSSAVDLPPAQATAKADSGPSLDLPGSTLEPKEPAAPVTDESAASLEQDDPEVATKLELAQAYEEMGDREGARELLMEVLDEGSPAQRELAKLRLERLG